jgi:hypothetical protein
VLFFYTARSVLEAPQMRSYKQQLVPLVTATGNQVVQQAPNLGDRINLMVIINDICNINTDDSYLNKNYQPEGSLLCWCAL